MIESFFKELARTFVRHVLNALLVLAGVIIGIIVGVIGSSWKIGLLVAAVIVLLALVSEVVTLVRAYRKAKALIGGLASGDPFGGNVWGGLLGGKKPAESQTTSKPHSGGNWPSDETLETKRPANDPTASEDN